MLIAIGTRPDAIKMYPLIKELKERKRFDVKVVSTGQHKDMLDRQISEFSIGIDRDLQIMNIGQTLFDITERIISGMSTVIEELLPDIVFVHGDTATAFLCGLCAFYKRIPICHVEAGLRTYDSSDPFPEEFYRRSIAAMASFHFAPTKTAAENLIREGIDKSRVFIVGNTVIDALVMSLSQKISHPLLDVCNKCRTLVFTAHRRESVDNGIFGMMRAISRIAVEFQDVKVIYPVHKNPRIAKLADDVLLPLGNVIITESLPVSVFHNILASSYAVVTDSGGIQEEVSFLGKPTVLMRNTTERKEIFANSCINMVGREEDAIYSAVKRLLLDEEFYRSAAVPSYAFGDGTAARKIADAVQLSFLCEK